MLLGEVDVNIDIDVKENDEDNAFLSSLSLSSSSFFLLNDKIVQDQEVRSRLKLDETLTTAHLFLWIDRVVVTDAEGMRRYNVKTKKQKKEIVT